MPIPCVQVEIARDGVIALVYFNQERLKRMFCVFYVSFNSGSFDFYDALLSNILCVRINFFDKMLHPLW